MVRQRKKAQRAGGAHSTTVAATDDLVPPVRHNDNQDLVRHLLHDARQPALPVPQGGQAAVDSDAATEMQVSLCASLPCHAVAATDPKGLAKAVRAVQSDMYTSESDLKTGCAANIYCRSRVHRQWTPSTTVRPRRRPAARRRRRPG